MHLTRRHLLLGLVLLPCKSRAGQQADGFVYRGFAVNDAAVRDHANFGQIREGLQQQIDIVLAVGLTPSILNFFQSLQVVVLPAGHSGSRSQGHYIGNSRRVELMAGFIRNSRLPVVLHEYLHAWHAEKLTGGRRNTQVLAFFNQATQAALYAKRSHMMSNAGEFLACAGTTFLHGTTAQEPFTRAALLSKQPDFAAFLQASFGPQAGTYQGTVDRPDMPDMEEDDGND